MVAVLWAVVVTPVDARSDLTDKVYAALQQTNHSKINPARDCNRETIQAAMVMLQSVA